MGNTFNKNEKSQSLINEWSKKISQIQKLPQNANFLLQLDL
jgi:hypothetical protein